MTRSGTIAFLIGLCFWGATAWSVPSVALDLVEVDPVNAPGVIRVDLIYQDDPAGSGLVFVQLDVAASSSNLTNGGTDFTRFSFAPASLLGDWNTAPPLADFGPDPLDSTYTVDLDSSAFPLAALLAGPHTLGTLMVDLSGLAPGTVATVALALPGPTVGTEAGQESDIGNLQTFFLVAAELGGTVGVDQVDIQVPQQAASDVPEPGTLLLGLIGLGALSRRRRSIAITWTGQFQ